MISGFLHNAQNYPERDCLLFNHKVLSYGDLMHLAQGIRKKLPKVSSKIGIYTSEDEYMYAGILAVLFHGAAFVPLNRKIPISRLVHIIDITELDAVLCTKDTFAECNEIVSQAKKDLPAIPADVDSGQENVWEAISHCSEEDLAYILFTSGSTGEPKGIPISHGNFNAFLQGMRHFFGFNNGDQDRVIHGYELSFDLSIGTIFSAWDQGASVLPVSTNKIVTIEIIKTISNLSPTVVSLPPSAVIYMDKMKLLQGKSFPSVKHTLFGAEAVPYNVVKIWQEACQNSKIYNAYGPTEGTVWCHLYECNENTEEEIVNGLIPIGKPFRNVQYRIVDEDGNDVREGETGQLIISGAQISGGYWKNDEKTKQVFSKEDDQEYGSYNTGDLVFKNEYGNVMYLNRMDNQVQINGFRVELGEVEYRLRQVTGNELSVVVAVKEQTGLTSLVAIVEASHIESATIIEQLREELPYYMVPRQVINIEKFPINNSGKINRKELSKMAAAT